MQQGPRTPKKVLGRLVLSVSLVLARIVIQVHSLVVPCKLNPLLCFCGQLGAALYYWLFAVFVLIADSAFTVVHSPMSCETLLLSFRTHRPYHNRSGTMKITDRSFRYASSHLWNQLSGSFRQPRRHLSLPDSSLLQNHISSPSPSPLSPSITPSLFRSHLKTFLFHKSFPP